jgi:hypothetical protein
MGGKKHVKIKSYTTACDWLLATAPILHLLDAWSNKDHYALGRADLELTVSSGSVDLSGHIPESAIAVETLTIGGGGTATVAHAATFLMPLGNPPVKYKGGQALEFSGSNPPGLGEYQVAAGVFSFNSGDIGQQVVISYAYSTGSVSDGNFVAVLGVAAEIDVSETFADYGDPAGSRTVEGTQRRWLYNTFWDPPEVFEPAYGITSRTPWTYTASGLVISVDSSLNGKKVIVRVAFRIPTSSWDGNPLSAIPFGMEFERQLGSGSEYVNHGDQQIVYPDCSGVASDRLDLGSGASYPQMSFEATCYHSLTADGDANPADAILTIAVTGVYNNSGFSGETTLTTLQMLSLTLSALGLGDGVPILAPLDDLRAFCEAYGIFVSVPMLEQRQAADWVNEILEVANAAVVASGFQIKIVPYCERSAIGNGVVYTAPTAAGPIYDFTERDYADKKQPVIIRRKRATDQYNLQPVAYTDRSNDYADGQTTGVDQGGIHSHMTQRAQPKTYKVIFSADVADKVGNVLVKKDSIECNEYEWKASGLRFGLAEAMDLVTLTDARVGLNKTPVRITEANEDQKKIVTFKGVDFFYGLNEPQQIASASQQGSRVDTQKAPGSVNDPIIFVEVPQLDSTGAGGTYIRLGISGASQDWGGAIVWASLDGTTYSEVGMQVGESLMGLTGGDFPVAADPDTVDDLPVDLSESFGTLDSYSVTYEDAFASLCYIEGGSLCIPYELISYAIAQLTSANHYTLKATGGNKLRRGIYSTPITDHASGSKFLSLAGPTVRLLVNPAWIGKTLHFKFTSFNQFGNQIESLADVTDYPYTIPVSCASAILGGRPDLTIDIPATTAGNFSVAHGMAATPKLALIQMTSAGRIWFQTARYDATNVYLVASDSGLTAKLLLYSVSPGAEVALAPSAPGNFAVAHGLGAAPAILLVQMTSGGEIYAQTPFADATNLELTASDAGVTGFAELWQPSTSSTAVAHVMIGLAPAFGGNFAVPHGLGVTPTAAFIRLSSAGEIWFQAARYDATFVYLVASDGGITASLEVFA